MIPVKKNLGVLYKEDYDFLTKINLKKGIAGYDLKLVFNYFLPFQVAFKYRSALNNHRYAVVLIHYNRTYHFCAIPINLE